MKTLLFIKKRYPIFLISLILAIALFKNNRWNENEVSQKAIFNDAAYYYAYLPGLFIHHDLSFKYLEGEKRDTSFSQTFSPDILENGRKFTKMPIGWALLNLPAFLVAHASAHLFNYSTDGFSTPYQFFVQLNNFLFVCLGLFVLFEILILFFSSFISNIILLIIAFGSNLYYYTTCTQPTSHGYSFALISIFLLYTIRWHQSYKSQHLYFLAFIFGLIFLVRPLNGIVGILFLLYGMNSKDYLVRLIHLIKINKKAILISFGIFCLVLLPQCMYWKYVSGSWFFDSYINEHFFWSRSMVYEFLFSYRKGWFLYTPIMLVMILGFIIQYESLNKLLPQIFMIMMIFIWINSCWWCWWFGGCFGSRVMVDYYGLFALPLGIVVSQLMKKHLMLKIVSATLIIFIIYLNQFQSYQAKITLIHYDSMSKELYNKVFLNDSWPSNYSELADPPDYDAAKNGKPVW